ncbi:BREX-1 system adenine-specific DNA-methyltransferase PglX [Streptomyces sp. NPDC048201]|uniref:BREX-1 system adenine-specific DNA-methyltransferase PglX n=1 Tax=Streptomyces sp. NPDC048201 TaxID=3365513 RepID=UPI00370F7C12
MIDANALKNFATWARTALLREVEARTTAVLVAGSVERVEHPGRVRRLEADIQAAGGGQAGRQAVIDKVAYTWFNRIIALRFMDANGYTGVGVVSPPEGQPGGQPEILVDAKNGVFDTDVVRQTVIDEVNALLDEQRASNNPQGEAYARLLAEYCHYWHHAMPFMFESDDLLDYTELLLPAALLAEDSIVSRTAITLTAEVCKDVEVIGWLYQFYIAERKLDVFAGFRKNKKAGAEEIPAATQLFTPHWIVRYLVENSVGRLWMLNHPSSSLGDQMDYYIAPANRQTDFLKITSPEELTVIDPACGSGHMLTYAFDLLYAIYEEEGYAPSEIPAAILKHNLYGTEIDPRAAALAAFALTMKARGRHRRFFSKQVEPNICVLNPISFTPTELNLLVTKDGDRHQEENFWNQFERADTLGSLIRPDASLIDPLREHIQNSLRGSSDLFTVDLYPEASKVLHQASVLAAEYVVSVANPPYMGSGNMNPVLSDFAKAEYSSAKTDLYAMFIDRCQRFAGARGSIAMVTQDSWLFLGAYAKYRADLLMRRTVPSLAHLGTGAFDTIGGEVVSTVAFILEPSGGMSAKSRFIRLIEAEGNSKGDLLAAVASGDAAEFLWERGVSEFLDIPNSPLIYWASESEITALRKGPYLESFLQAREGLTTGDNDRYLRRWYEISMRSIGFNVKNPEDAVKSGARWFPYQKGGASRRWYGNFDYVVDWENDGERPRANVDTKTGRIRSHNYNGTYAFKCGLTWPSISGEGFSVRHVEGGFMFDTKGPMAFPERDGDLLTLEGFLNSSTATRFMRLLAPRLDFKLGHVLSLPVRVRSDARVAELVTRCIELAKAEWDDSELSVDFQKSPIIDSGNSIPKAVDSRRERELLRHSEMVSAENEMDAFFAGEYLGEDAHFETLTLPNRAKSAFNVREWIEDLVSYAVGCMFGRYSLDESGLILADQGATLDDYRSKVPKPSFLPDEENVIPVLGDDRFEDDIVARFRKFLRAAFGEERFEENLRFVTEELGVKDMREYFVKKFYEGHVQRYKKRPIYWMFSSPKGTFNALVYLHRYTPSTASTVLGYLREYRNKLASALENAERTAQSATGREAAAARKEAVKLRKDLVELEAYEHEVLYPLATQRIELDLNDGVKANYPKLGRALKKINGLEAK